MRSTGHEVLFICATDEHGTPAELAALDHKMSVEQFCERCGMFKIKLQKIFLFLLIFLDDPQAVKIKRLLNILLQNYGKITS